MVITLGQVLSILDIDEPRYSMVGKLGSEALPHLETLVRTAEPMLASKAAFMAGLIDHDRSVSILMTAAQSKDAMVRMAAAGGCRYIRLPRINDVLNRLKNDEDIGVRNKALKIIRLRSSIKQY